MSYDREKVTSHLLHCDGCGLYEKCVTHNDDGVMGLLVNSWRYFTQFRLDFHSKECASAYFAALVEQKWAPREFASLDVAAFRGPSIFPE